ncbi:acyl-CoA thioesterase [Metabacillus litoralis]|jgi:acyl-CoA hydrolase|uniref:acyl-CoA thioesterase n=1 Tax=Metabacillus litoralis TaxID=152268 RepID=UPI00203C0A6B|nr:acyl-CoA thioesterase [Metabacillus litoralis]MCM3654524.1 acyl-CoA thioesterase [Metabacillus litoralis]
MEERTEKKCKDSLVFKTARVFPLDTNNHNTLFGGKLMSYIDDVASISAAKHSRGEVVTASIDSVDFLIPIRQSDSVNLSSYVSYVGRSSMEVFVKVIAEDLKTGERKLAATSFLTFVALDDQGKPMLVPKVIPESQEEISLYNTAQQRIIQRKERREHSKSFATVVTL